MGSSVFFPRRFMGVGALAIAILASPRVFAQISQHTPRTVRPPVEIRTSDVDLFYKIYDAAGDAPTADALQHDYIEAGSDGVRQFIPSRIKSAEALSMTVAGNPAIYNNARACMTALPAVRTRLSIVFEKLAAMVSRQTFPRSTLLMGENNPCG